jgi:hypothetical protein
MKVVADPSYKPAASIKPYPIEITTPKVRMLLGIPLVKKCLT